MKRIFFDTFILSGFAFSIYYVFNFFIANLPTNITSNNILRITPGMTLEQVTIILGRPLSVKALIGIHNNECCNPNPTLDQGVNNDTDIEKLVNNFISSQTYCCEGNKDEISQLNQITLVYTHRGFLSSYPMLWVHLDKSFRVNNVFAKEYEGGIFGDDPGIYSLGWGTDSSGTKYNHAKTVKWMNKERFYRCFK